MGGFKSSEDIRTGGNGYLHDALPPENVYGHTKKVRLLRNAIERVRQESGRASLRMLDIGCGSGYAVTRFLGKVGDDVLGIDMYPPNIAYAEAHFKRDGLSFACLDAHSLAGNDRVFDIVVLADVLEHLDDPATILATAVELLAPSGRLLVTVPNGRGPFEIESALSRVHAAGPVLLWLMDRSIAVLDRTVLRGVWSRAAASLPKNLPYNMDFGHVRFFSRSAMLELIHDTGLEVVGSRNISFLSGPFTNYLFSPFPAFCDWNVQVADRLPYWLASAWFFECSKASDKD